MTVVENYQNQISDFGTINKIGNDTKNEFDKYGKRVYCVFRKKKTRW